MKENNSKEKTLLTELLTTVGELGVDDTIRLLKSAQGEGLIIHDERVEYVLKMVSLEFKTPIQDVINSYDKSSKRKFSIMFGTFYLHKTFGFSFGDLQGIYKRDKGLLCRYFHQIKNLKVDDAGDKALLRYRDKFDIAVSSFNPKK